MSVRRFPLAPLLFCFLWTLLLLLPTTREVALSQWKARFGIEPPENAPSSNDSSREADIVRALGNPETFIQLGSRQQKAFEKLGKRYPDDATICAAQILSGVSGLNFASTRHPGPSSSGDLNWSVRLTKVTKPTPETLQSWFAATERGTKLEPNNTFWDWAKIIGLFANGRDAEVWDVLKGTRGKTAFDDHASDLLLARLHVAKRARKSPLDPVHQLNVASSIWFPYSATLRESTRRISDNAAGLRLSGVPANQTKALEGLRDLVFLGRLVRRESKKYLTSTTGQSCESIGLWGGAYSPASPSTVKRPLPGASVAAYGSDKRSLLFFARQLGRADVATQLSRDWVELGKWRKKTRAAIPRIFSIGFNVSDMITAQMGDWLGALLIAGMPVLLVWTVVCSALLRFIPRWHREGAIALSSWTWVYGTLLAIASIILFSSSALWQLWDELHFPSLGTTPYELFIAVEIYGDSGGVRDVPPIWQHYFLACVGMLFACWGAVKWDAQRAGKPSLATRLRHVLVAPEDGLTRFDVSPLLSLMGLLAFFGLGTVGLVAFFVLPVVSEDVHVIHDYAAPILTALTLVVLAPLLWRLRTTPGRVFALSLTQRLAWGQLLCLTLLWGLLWMLAAPAQKRFDAGFERHIRVGEFQLMRPILGLK